MTNHNVMLLAALSAVVAACASPSVRSPEPPAAARSAIESTEETYRLRATSLAENRRWADAAVQWELLSLLRPESKDYRAEAEAALRRGADAAAAHVRAGEEARKRGNNELATTSFLRALSADPGNTAAAAGLKAIEVDRTRRAWLERMPRVPYTPLDKPPSDAAADDPPARK